MSKIIEMGMENNADPYQTAPLGTVCYGSTMFIVCSGNFHPSPKIINLLGMHSNVLANLS